MTVYMKNFVFASLVYLGLATIIGALNGMTDIGYIGTFAHTHLNLLGFMAMIVFGIGYFILPRFNGANLRFENWVSIHFWIANISLPGMVIFRGLEIETGESIYSVLFIICATLQAISIFMFIINIWLTLTVKEKPKTESTSPSQPAQPKPAPQKQTFEISASPEMNVPVLPESKIGELVDRLPSVQQVLIEQGLLALQMPGHIDKVRKMGITIEVAARNHSLDLDKMILAVEEEFHNHGFTTRLDLNQISAAQSEPVELDTSILIGDIIERYPVSRTVFQKYFGDGCFDCPGQAYESVDMACRMHGIEPDTFLEELKTAIK